MFTNDRYIQNTIPVDIEEVIHTTNKAFLIKALGYKMWVPKSRIQNIDKHGTVMIIDEYIFKKAFNDAIANKELNPDE